MLCMNISVSKIKGTRERIDEESVLEEKIMMEKRKENSQVEMLGGVKSMGAGAATIASVGTAIIGNVLSSSIHFVALNPSLAKQLFGYAILGFALTEAIASFAPMMACLISFIFQWEEDKWERAEREQSEFQWWVVFAVPQYRSRLEKGYSISAAMLARKGLKELTLGRDLKRVLDALPVVPPSSSLSLSLPPALSVPSLSEWSTPLCSIPF
ncbi:ATP synthase subunit 9, mitochondrial [Capsicum baccatum]|uniref:ATP synthase subunit 9, mitochondrial n=1 Tax=Capsicum baccatum TaxID=33114 RepID=A0A2G2VKU1_CAPBA|nr:ATP synthase subunit 9, mitochondrial [Capsicum baccatum]